LSPQFHLVLLVATTLSTVVAGTGIAANYAAGRPAFSADLSLAPFRSIVQHPGRLALGLPFACTLLAILLAHEFGHYLTCRHYGLRVSYPYFIPAPTLIGTMGAFIRIRSPILNRRLLLDVAVAGPIAGFVLAAPALAWGVLCGRLAGGAAPPDEIIPGTPLALVLLTHLLRPSIHPAQLALTPVGLAGWVGLFVTALNLLPMGQLDGGHILYAVIGRRHRLLSRSVSLALLPLGWYCWPGWYLWAAILWLIGTGHPPVMFPADPLGRRRQVLAIVAGLIFALCFMPTPFSVS
jgi:membrane-associated protease RseP (regulator of RpoE activity)